VTDPTADRPPLTLTQWLVIIVACIGFLFDTYELLMFPVIARPAIAELLQVPGDSPLIRDWLGRSLWIAALCGGVFGLLGGWLIDRFGRKTVMAASILVYSFSPVFAAFSTSLWMLILFRCTTFIGICVEFVAAITWLAELFADRRQRELVLGWTQAFASVGGLFVTEIFGLSISLAEGKSLHGLPLPEGFNGNAAWRYTLLTGLVPGLLIAVLLPFVPESQVWAERKRAGTLRRPRIAELFAPGLARTTLVTAALSACAYAAAFGALQVTPGQVAPGLPELASPRQAVMKESADLEKRLKDAPEGSAEKRELSEAVAANRKKQAELRAATEKRGQTVQRWQELGGLAGRILLALLVVVIASRRALLRVFQVPGLVVFPLTYLYLFRDRPELFDSGIFLCGLVTVAQFSYFGEYLPKAFPVHLRGTGGSFATNVGGRMVGTFAAFLTTNLVAPLFQGVPTFTQVAYAAAAVGGGVYLIGLILSVWLPEPEPVPE
jgi:MFS family permease